MTGMMFWLIAAALTGLTCLALLAALGGKAGVTHDNGHDRRFYDQQIAEIARQKASGLMGDAEAEAALAEAGRRLLAAAETPPAATGGTGGRRVAAIAVLVLTPAIALPAYLLRGRPDMPGFALATRDKPKPALDGQIEVASAIQQIEAHLQKNPEDGRGHEVIAPVYLRMGRAAQAVQAYGEALRILGPTADRHANLGEAHMFLANGVVTAPAKAAFAAALALDASHVKARFFTALAAEQDGDQERAVTLLSGLMNDLPDGALKTEISGQLAALSGVPKGGETLAALPQTEQKAAIRSMVEGLAARLAANGGSAEEWARLVRALRVLGEGDRALAILTEARQKFAANPAELKLIEDAARATP